MSAEVVDGAVVKTVFSKEILIGEPIVDLEGDPESHTEIKVSEDGKDFQRGSGTRSTIRRELFPSCHGLD